MPKKLIFVFMVALFLSSVRVVFASLIINEIMYDLSGADSASSKSREWVEIYNPDSVDVSIDASKWRLYDGAGNRIINGGVDFVIPASSYVVFAGNKDNFLADHVGFSGIVYDTGITSLNNTGATIKLLDQDGNVVDSVTYTSTQGAAGDGNSLQRSPSGWITATPTPGAINQSSSSSSTTSSGGGGIGLTSGTISTTSSSSSSAESKSKNTEESKIKTEIRSSNLAFVNSSLKLEATSYGYSKEVLHFGKYFWNFGDGDYKEGDVMVTKTISHIYFYPGDYTITLEYYSNAYGEIPDTVTRFSVKVISADLVISRVGVDPDFFIEILNNTNYDADISRWFLVSDKKNFIFPKNTIIDSKNKIILSGRITNFTSSDQTSLKLLNTEGAVVFDFGRNTKNTNTSNRNVDLVKNNSVISKEVPKNLTKKEENISENTEPEKLPIADHVQLAANTINSNTDSSSKSSNMPMVYFALLVGCSSSLVYFIRRNKTSKNPGDDFEILE